MITANHVSVGATSDTVLFSGLTYTIDEPAAVAALQPWGELFPSAALKSRIQGAQLPRQLKKKFSEVTVWAHHLRPILTGPPKD